jgi:hypothetical protein
VKTSPKGKRKTFPKILIGDIRRIPIRDIPLLEQTPFIKKADFMLENNKLM